jgi:hypothetical protein
MMATPAWLPMLMRPNRHLHLWQRGGTQVGGGPGVFSEGVVPLGQAGRLERLPHGVAGVVDQDVDRAELGAVRATRLASAASSARAVTTGTAAPPVWRMLCAARSNASARRAASTTRAPSAASMAASPAPIPIDAPVTTATRSVDAVIVDLLASRLTGALCHHCGERAPSEGARQPST